MHQVRQQVKQKVKSFSLCDAFKFAFKNYATYFTFFFPLSLIFMVIYAVVSHLFMYLLTGKIGLDLTLLFSPSPSSVKDLLGIVPVMVIQEFFSYLMIRSGIQIYSKRSPSWQDLRTIHFSDFFTFLGARILLIFKIFLGVLLFIIPGIYFMVRYFFVGFSLVDGKAQSVHQDMQIAYALSSRVGWPLLWLLIILGIFGYFWGGILPFLMYPLLDLTAVHVYEQLMQYYEEGETK